MEGKGKCILSCWFVLVFISILLLSLSFTTLEPNQVALEYGSFSRYLNNDEVFRPGRYFLGLGNSFSGTSGSLAIPTTWQKLSFCSLCTESDGPDIDGYTEDTSQGGSDTGSRNVVQVSIEIHAFYRLRESLLVELIRKFPQRNWKSRYTFVIKNQVLEVLSTSELDDLLMDREDFQQRMAEKINDAFTTTEVQLVGLNPGNYTEGAQVSQGSSRGTVMKSLGEKELRLKGLRQSIVVLAGQTVIEQPSLSAAALVSAVDADTGDLFVTVTSAATFQPQVACTVDGADVGMPSNVFAADLSITQDRGTFEVGQPISIGSVAVGSPITANVLDYRVYGQLVALYYGAVELDSRIEDLFLERWLTKQKQIKAGVTGATDLYKADTDKLRAVIEREESEMASNFEVTNKQALANGTAFGDRLILESQVNGYEAMVHNLDLDNENLLKLIYYRKLWESANSVVAGFEGSAQLLSTL